MADEILRKYHEKARQITEAAEAKKHASRKATKAHLDRADALLREVCAGLLLLEATPEGHRARRFYFLDSLWPDFDPERLGRVRSWCVGDIVEDARLYTQGHRKDVGIFWEVYEMYPNEVVSCNSSKSCCFYSCLS